MCRISHAWYIVSCQHWIFFRYFTASVCHLLPSTTLNLKCVAFLCAGHHASVEQSPAPYRKMSPSNSLTLGYTRIKMFAFWSVHRMQVDLHQDATPCRMNTSYPHGFWSSEPVLRSGDCLDDLLLAEKSRQGEGRKVTKWRPLWGPWKSIFKAASSRLLSKTPKQPETHVAGVAQWWQLACE